ncbi:Uma2 family endonuclease [Spirosoma endbachense]|nr:Uma2 family endonuclease [Spirosoma endbachense]
MNRIDKVMPVAVAIAPKKRKRSKVPSYLIYETLNGRPLYYRNYKAVIAGQKKPAEIMGSSSLQAALVATLVMFLGRTINRKKYLVVTNESGVHVDRGNNLSNDIAIFDKAANIILTNKYFDTAPKIAIEVDVRIEPEEFEGKESGYVYEKTQRLLDFGVERVIWITTQPRKIFVATQIAPWTTQDWDVTIPVLDDVVLNLAELLTEEGIEF